MYAKHGNLVDAEASGAKANTKYLESRLEVIQGHAFWITEKLTRDCILLYNNVGFDSKISKERSEHFRFQEPHCHSAPPREPLRILAQTLYF